MMKRLLFATLIIFFVAPGAVAQTGGSTQNSLLPEIDPQDIEIRSEFKARFPGIRRQPILGFNPKPRVFRIDPNRVPFMESDREAVANIALTELDRPVPPQRSILTNPKRGSIYLKSGIGSFLTPELEAYAFRRLNEQSIISGNMDFTSSNGHLNNQDSGFRFFNLNGFYGIDLKNGVKASVKTGAFNDFNHLFDLSPNVPNDNSGTPQKDYIGFNAGVIIEDNQNSLEGWQLYLNGAVLDVDLMAPNAALRGGQGEQHIQAGYERTWAGKKLYDVFTGNIDLRMGNYSSEENGNTQWMNTQATFEYSTLYNYSTTISLEGGLAYLSDGNRNGVAFISNASMHHTIKQGLSLSGALFTRPEMKTLWEHHQTNRFIGANAMLEYQYEMGVNGGLEYAPIEATKLYSTVTYKFVDNYGYYMRNEELFGANEEQLFYEVNYADINSFKLEVGIAQQITSDRFWFDGRVYAQRMELKSGGDVPFEERLGAEGMLSLKPLSDVSISTWLQYVGKREDPANEEDLSAYSLLNAEAEYSLNEKFGVYFKVLNILGQKYEIWQGYEERPFQIFGGIKINL